MDYSIFIHIVGGLATLVVIGATGIHKIKNNNNDGEDIAFVALMLLFWPLILVVLLFYLALWLIGWFGKLFFNFGEKRIKPFFERK